MFAKKERCPQIPCKGLPWFPDGFLLYFYNRKEIKLYHKSKLTWETSIGDLCHRCHWKPPQEYQPGGCTEIFCCMGATPVAGYFTSGTFTDQIQTTSKLHLLLVAWLPITNASYINLMSSSLHCHLTEHQGHRGHRGFAMVLLYMTLFLVDAVCLCPRFERSWRDWKLQKQAVPNKAIRDLGVKTVPGPELTAAHPEAGDWSGETKDPVFLSSRLEYLAKPWRPVSGS